MRLTKKRMNKNNKLKLYNFPTPLKVSDDEFFEKCFFYVRKYYNKEEALEITQNMIANTEKKTHDFKDFSEFGKFFSEDIIDEKLFYDWFEENNNKLIFECNVDNILEEGNMYKQLFAATLMQLHTQKYIFAFNLAARDFNQKK